MKNLTRELETDIQVVANKYFPIRQQQQIQYSLLDLLFAVGAIDSVNMAPLSENQ